MIGSAVLTLEPDSNLIESIMRQLDREDAIETGNLIGYKLPITMEAENPASLESLTKWIQQMDGVQFVDIAFVSLSDTQSLETS